MEKKKGIAVATWKSNQQAIQNSAHARTDAGVLERRQAERT